MSSSAQPVGREELASGCSGRLSRAALDDPDQLGRGRRLVEPLLAKHLTGQAARLSAIDLADPEMIITEDLGPALLLNFVMTGAGAPTDHRLLVPPYRKRQ